MRMDCITMSKPVSRIIPNDGKPAMIHKVALQLHYKKQYPTSFQLKSYTQGIGFIKSMNI